MLILAVPEDLDKLLKYGGLAAVTSLSKGCRVVIMTIDVAFVLIIAVLCSEDCRAYRACKVLDMVFTLQSCDV